MGKKVKKVPTKKAAKSKVATKRATSVSKKKVTPVKAKTKARVQKTASPKTKSIKKKPAKKKPSGPTGYTTTEYEKFKEERNRLSQLSNQALKDILRKNMQSMSGTKDVLIEKVADGIVLGRIPRCPNCFGGRPKYDYKTGIYSCPGYRDDEDYKNCHSTFTKEQLKRDPWE